MNRRSLIQLLVGAIAAIAGLGSLTFLRQDRCRDAGGQWSSAERFCAGPNGPIAVERWSDVAIAIALAFSVAWILYRMSTFVNRSRSSPPS